MLAILVLLFRRLPIVLALYKLIPAIKTWREAVFTGWFGPIGVGAIFYYSVAIESVSADGPNAHAHEVLKPVIYFMVLASVIAHGITIPLFYIGTFATRTLTRTSESGNPVLHIPKFENFGKGSPIIIEQVQEKEITKPVEASLVKEQPQQQRHTAITIMTPEEIKHRQESPPSISTNSSVEEIPPNQHNTSRRRSHVVVDDDDCTMYLP